MEKVILISPVEEIVNRAKGDVCKEFEKICATEMAFKRMKKEMHDIFDRLIQELNETR